MRRVEGWGGGRRGRIWVIESGFEVEEVVVVVVVVVEGGFRRGRSGERVACVCLDDTWYMDVKERVIDEEKYGKGM